MAIKFTCQCGTPFVARDAQAGIVTVCHVCGRRFQVPFSDEAPVAQPVIATGSFTRSTAVSGRRSSFYPLIVILIAIPIVILVGFVSYFTFARPNTDARSEQPRTEEFELPATPQIKKNVASDLPKPKEEVSIIAPEKPAPQTPLPPAIESTEQPVDLRGHAPPVGLSFREVTRFQGETTETAVGIRSGSITTDMTRDLEYVYTVTAVANDAVTGCLIRVVKGEGTISFVDTKGAAHQQDRVDDLAGEVIVAQKTGAAWRYALQGKTPTLKQEQALHKLRPMFEHRDFLPAAKQKVGATWKLDSAQIQNLAGSEFSSVSGSVRADLPRLERYEGALCAVIEYKGTFKGRDELPETQGSIRTFEMDQVVYLNLKYGLNAKTTGETTVTSAGKRRMGGVNLQVTSSSRITIVSTTTVEQ
jgi:hypothetical protein